MLEMLAHQARLLGHAFMGSIETHAWAWISLIVITLVILIRRQRGGSL
jgi:hypothetical protein